MRLKSRTVESQAEKKLPHQVPLQHLVKQRWDLLMLKLGGYNMLANYRDEIAVYRFIKSYRKFGDPCSRLQDIAADASLHCKQSQLKKLAQTLHTSCVDAEQKSLKITQPTANGN